MNTILPIACCFIYWRLRRPHWRNADGAKGIFGFCWTHVGCGPASGPTLKRPYAVLVRWWDGEQIKYNERDSLTFWHKVFIHSTSLPRTRCNTKSIFQQSTTDLNSEFSFSYAGCHTKVKELVWPTINPQPRKWGRRIVGFRPFPKVSALWEMQTATSRVWILDAQFISYEDNRYARSAYRHKITLDGLICS